MEIKGESAVFKEKYSFNDLIEIIKILRGPDGCPWDREQTHGSVKKHLLEETYEVLEVIESERKDLLCEELGDLLLQIVFHARIAEEEGSFTIDDIINGISKKMVSRHTHVFGEDKANTSDEVLVNWEKNKKIEKGMETHAESLKSIPVVLPALIRSEKIQKKAAKLGFDWRDSSGAFDKLREEISELEEAEKSGEKLKMHEEFGDMLFAMVNVARFLQIDPEFALADASNKFVKRFEKMENAILNEGKRMEDMEVEEMDIYWEKIKHQGEI